MFKHSIHKLPSALKISMLFICILSLFSYILFYLKTELSSQIQLQYGITINFPLLVDNISLIPLIGCLLFLVCFMCIIIYDLITFTKKLSLTIKDSLDDRKLSSHFEHFFNPTTFAAINTNLKSILSLYKSFDNMKTARIVLEVATIRQLMNHVDEGLILVGKDLTVTHINHVAEHDLGLIPSECIGQAISRKINNEILLSSLQKAFEFDTKFVDLDLEDDKLSASIYPLKDKFGDSIRALIILKIKPEQEKIKTEEPPPEEPIPSTKKDKKNAPKKEK